MRDATAPGSTRRADVPDAAGVPNLEVSGLQVASADGLTVIVDEVCFTVAAGQVLGLVGESGSGKTTVALALLGHARRGLRIAAGEVRLAGRNVLTAPPAALRRLRGLEISYVPQDPASALNPVLRVGAQVAEALRVHPGAASDPRERVGEVLREVGITPDREMLRRYPHQLSGGQQQRVALAMAFACRPRVIVLDEPTTGLDVTVQRHVLDTVRTLCAAYGVAAVYVSHDLAVVSGLATAVAVMYAGRIVELGDTGQVFSTPGHPYTRGLISSIPSARRSETLQGIAGQPPRPGQRPGGCAFEPRCEWRTDRCAAEAPAPAEAGGRTVRCIRAGDILEPGTRQRRQAVAAPEEGEPELAVRGLAAFYGDRQVLSGVDLTAYRKQCVAVVGESGAGKTTLAHCIAGLSRNWTGEISLGGTALHHDVRARDRDQLRRVQYIFQNPYLSLNPRKTIGQILREPLQHFFRLPRADAVAEVRKVIADVSLGASYLDRYPDQLSGGERQRVAIARALVVKPEVLVCDEVTSALDVSVQAVIVELLRRLQTEHELSMIFITHNLALVRSIAQNCIVLSDGRVVEAGPVARILEHPTHPYPVQLISDMPLMPAEARVVSVPEGEPE